MRAYYRWSVMTFHLFPFHDHFRTVLLLLKPPLPLMPIKTGSWSKEGRRMGSPRWSSPATTPPVMKRICLFRYWWHSLCVLIEMSILGTEYMFNPFSTKCTLHLPLHHTGRHSSSDMEFPPIWSLLSRDSSQAHTKRLHEHQPTGRAVLHSSWPWWPGDIWCPSGWCQFFPIALGSHWFNTIGCALY